MHHITTFLAEGDGWFDINSISETLGLKNGWFVAIVGVLFVTYLLLRGHLVPRRSVDSKLKVLTEALRDERESRKLWQASSVELLKTNDIERANSQHLLTVVETILKIVTDLQAARQTIKHETDSG